MDFFTERAIGKFLHIWFRWVGLILFTACTIFSNFPLWFLISYRVFSSILFSCVFVINCDFGSLNLPLTVRYYDFHDSTSQPPIRDLATNPYQIKKTIQNFPVATTEACLVFSLIIYLYSTKLMITGAMLLQKFK